MVAIARTGASTSAAVGAPARKSPNLEAQMRTCRAQLADWVTCPSAKTPEGKAKIEQITAKLDSIKDQIKKSDGTAPAASGRRVEVSGASGLRSNVPTGSGAAEGQVGTHVDTYA